MKHILKLTTYTRRFIAARIKRRSGLLYGAVKYNILRIASVCGIYVTRLFGVHTHHTHMHRRHKSHPAHTITHGADALSGHLPFVLARSSSISSSRSRGINRKWSTRLTDIKDGYNWRKIRFHHIHKRTRMHMYNYSVVHTYICWFGSSSRDFVIHTFGFSCLVTSGRRLSIVKWVERME